MAPRWWWACAAAARKAASCWRCFSRCSIVVLGTLSDYPIPLNAGIFSLMDRKALDSVLAMREKNRYLPGLRAWVGYKNAIVYYDRNDRAGGEGKLSFISRIKYAMDAITSFSYKPLRLSFGLLAFSSAIATILALCMFLPVGAIAAAAFGIAASVFFMGGLLLLSIGILGEYIGRVYDEVRNRPLSLISHVHRAQVMIPSQLGMIAMPGGYGTMPEAYAISADSTPDESHPRGVTQTELVELAVPHSSLLYRDEWAPGCTHPDRSLPEFT